jgi:hypothetical protein
VSWRIWGFSSFIILAILVDVLKGFAHCDRLMGDVAADLAAGMAQFVSHFAEPGDPEYAPPVPKCETRVCSFFLYCLFMLWYFFLGTWTLLCMLLMCLWLVLINFFDWISEVAGFYYGVWSFVYREL